jgi:hypothetical protein
MKKRKGERERGKEGERKKRERRERKHRFAEKFITGQIKREMTKLKFATIFFANVDSKLSPRNPTEGEDSVRLTSLY